MGIIPGYDGYFSFSKNKHGYSGVAIYVKQPLRPSQVSEKIITDDLSSEFISTNIITQPPELLDAEGRSLIMDFGMFVLFNIYFPNNGSDDRSYFKMDYHHCVRERIDLLLNQGRQVILVGDINSVHEEIDHCDPLQSIKDNDLKHFKDLPHRQWLDQLISPKGPLIDTCRLSHPDRKGMFTCWNTRINARPANYGTRIDYILISEGLLPWFKKADIQPEIMGSDHCPVYMDFLDTLGKNDSETTTIKLNDLLLKNNATSTILSTCPLLATNFNEFKQNKLFAYFGKKTTNSITSKITSSSTIQNTNEEKNKIQQNSATTTTTTTTSSSSSLTSSTAIFGNNNNSNDSNISNLTSKKRKDIPSTNINQNTKRQTMTSFFEKVNKKSSSSTLTTKEYINNKDEDDDQPIDIEKILSQVEERKEVNKVWNNIFQQKSIPKCNVHNENCIELTVNKKGPNQGRRFYLCSKPVGPQNSTNNHVDYRCNFFQWKHDKK